MRRDIRDTTLYQEAEALNGLVRRPGTGQISDVTDLHVAPDGRSAVFTAAIVDKLEGTPLRRIAQMDLFSGEKRLFTFGPNTDRCPKYSPTGTTIAFLSDRSAGDFQLYLLDLAVGAVRATAHVHGWVEYLHWSPDGQRILLGVAGHGADVAGAQGAISSQAKSDGLLTSWMPIVESGVEETRWRRAWVYEVESQSVRAVSPPDLNVWEASWCGKDAIVAVVSPGPGEGLWYTSNLQRIDITSGSSREIFSPSDQLGWPGASASGRYASIVEAVASDRGIVAGELHVIELENGRARTADARKINTAGVDVTHAEWQTDRHLLIGGHREFATVIGVYDVESDQFTESWESTELTGVGRYLTLAGLPTPGECAFIAENFIRAPEIGVVKDNQYRTVSSFDLGYQEAARTIDRVEQVTWSATDGLEIQGWLLRPQGSGPYPLVMYVHGGPVWHWRPACLASPRSLPLLMLLKRGYAVFFPNPRGSSGRGQDFARRVKGDMNGADTGDFLSGLDHLVEIGVADPKRLGVAGVSYGGGMSSWLITQDSRFAAAVPISPHTNQVTEHLLSNIPHFAKLFLADDYKNAGGKYYTRSPIMYAHQVKTPTLNICGALDRCTPPEEAMQFHNALIEHGIRSVLVTYPEEGHGVHKWPAAIDYAARVVGWFEEHMGAEKPAEVKGESP